jgi:hypothetical protein
MQGVVATRRVAAVLNPVRVKRRSSPMSPIDEKAAEREMEKAAECVERADELTTAAMLAADTLLERANEHVEQAAQLRGDILRRARHRSRRSR